MSKIDKKEFRKYAKEIRQNIISFDNKTKSICEKLFELEEFKSANIICSYMNIQSEVATVDINNMILKQKKTLALPKVFGKNMEFHQVLNLKKDLEIGSFNVLEPNYNLPIIDKFDIILVPALAFSKSGFRLGYGAGYYDRYLKDKEGIFIGICFAEQIFDEIPKEEFDIKMDILITPEGSIKI